MTCVDESFAVFDREEREKTMYTDAAGEAVSGGVIPGHQVELRDEATSSSVVPRGVVELVDLQQRAHLLHYAQHYRRLLMPTAAVRMIPPPTSATLQSHPALGCTTGLLSFIYSKLQDVGGPISAASHQHLRFLQVAAAAATAPGGHHDEPKPSQSYIGLIAMAILSSKERKLVLSDIYQWILDHYAYFRYRGPGWRNSIRHNLSLNDCFVKAGRSANGKGHYWAIHPANVDDFERGDFRRRRAQRKVRRAMGLSVPDDDDSPGPSPSAPAAVGLSPPGNYCSWTPSRSPPFYFAQRAGQPLPPHAWDHTATSTLGKDQPSTARGPQQADGELYCRRDCEKSAQRHQAGAKRRLFDMESILAPDDAQPSHVDATSVTGTAVDDAVVLSHRDEEHISHSLIDSSEHSECKVGPMTHVLTTHQLIIE